MPCDADSQHEKHKSGDAKDEAVGPAPSHGDGSGKNARYPQYAAQMAQIAAVTKKNNLEKPGSLAGGRHLCMLIVLVECFSLIAYASMDASSVKENSSST